MKNKINKFSVFITVLQVITNICFRFWIRLILLAFAVPNYKIVYKNGHVEKFFFKKWSFKNGVFEWDSGGAMKIPKILAVDEIMVVTEIY